MYVVVLVSKYFILHFLLSVQGPVKNQTKRVPADSGRSQNLHQRGVLFSIWSLFMTALVAHHGNEVCGERERAREGKRERERERITVNYSVYSCG